jgi:hypothetical protein
LYGEEVAYCYQSINVIPFCLSPCDHIKGLSLYCKFVNFFLHGLNVDVVIVMILVPDVVVLVDMVIVALNGLIVDVIVI